MESTELVEHRLTEVEERTKSLQHRVDEVEKRQITLQDIAGAVKVLAVREENVEAVVGEIKDDVKRLADKPARRWDSLIDKVATTLVAAVIGYCMARIGM